MYVSVVCVKLGNGSRERERLELVYSVADIGGIAPPIGHFPATGLACFLLTVGSFCTLFLCQSYSELVAVCNLLSQQRYCQHAG